MIKIAGSVFYRFPQHRTRTPMPHSRLRQRLKDHVVTALAAALGRSAYPLDHILHQAVRLKRGQLSQAAFVSQLNACFTALSVAELKQRLDYPTAQSRVRQSGYKFDLLQFGEAPPWWDLGRLWTRRLALLRHANVRLDLLRLEGGKTIPPHAHHGVVSVFLVLEGELLLRQYQALEYRPSSVRLTLTRDTCVGEGGFAINSEVEHNLHWFEGLAPETILFRINVSGIPSLLPNLDHRDGRLFVDPRHLALGETGDAPFTTQQAVADLRMSPAAMMSRAAAAHR